MNLNKQEISNIRNVFAQLGWEYTPDQVEQIKELKSLKEEFLKVKPVVQELKERMDNKEIDFEEFVISLGKRFNGNCSEDQAKHLLLLNCFFE
jgi:Ca2+-binding EF-hand superfamily protein